MSWIDWSIVSFYLAYITWTGIRLGRKKEGLEDYLLANRSLPWWAVGLSIMATQMSAITLVGATGKGFEDGLRFIQFYFGLPLAMVILCVTLVPFFRKARVYTAYEYLEQRFDAKTRTLTSFVFLLCRGLSCGVIIAAPSVIISVVFGWNEILTIVAVGLCTTIYTMFGGVRAVTWTDVRQMVIILIGLTVAVTLILLKLPPEISLGDTFRIAAVSGHLDAVDFRFSLKETYTFWSGLIGGLFLMLSYFGCDQSQVQRYLTARTLPQAQSSLLITAVLKIPLQLIILLIGVFVFVFYQFEKPPLIFHVGEERSLIQSDFRQDYQALSKQYSDAWEMQRKEALRFARAGKETAAAVARKSYLNANTEAAKIRSQALRLVKEKNGGTSFTDVNYVFPSFIIKQLPIGAVGLLIAAIFAAAMSSVSSELNALATISVIDIYRRHLKPKESDGHYLLVSRFAAGLWGIFACIVAYYASRLGALIEVVNKFGSVFYGSLLGVFILALFCRRATGRGAFYGLLAGVALVLAIDNSSAIAEFFGNPFLLSLSKHLQMSFLWYNVIGVLAVVSIGLLLSIFPPNPRRDK